MPIVHVMSKTHGDQALEYDDPQNKADLWDKMKNGWTVAKKYFSQEDNDVRLMKIGGQETVMKNEVEKFEEHLKDDNAIDFLAMPPLVAG